jgi:homocysteine S-methyltransferase
VAGSGWPEALRRLGQAADPARGLALAREMLEAARRNFAGACLMPPFGRYELLSRLLPA